jgi:hypothetical protein
MRCDSARWYPFSVHGREVVSMGIPTHLHMIVESKEYEPREEVFIEQVQDLRLDLAEAGATFSELSRPEGHKGGADTNTIELLVTGGAGLATIAKVVTVWITNRGRRSVRLVTRRDGKTSEISLDAKNVSEEKLLRFLEDGPSKPK